MFGSDLLNLTVIRGGVWIKFGRVILTGETWDRGQFLIGAERSVETDQSIDSAFGSRG